MSVIYFAIYECTKCGTRGQLSGPELPPIMKCPTCKTGWMTKLTGDSSEN